MDKNICRDRTFNIFVLVLLSILLSYYLFSAPFPNKEKIFHIALNESVDSVSTKLKDQRVVRNEFILKFFINLLKSGKGIINGDYKIEKDSPVWMVAWQISRGHHNINPIRVTIIEGSTNNEIAILLADKLALFRRDLFISESLDKQGYLFPDTYFFFSMDTTEEIINKLSNNFKSKIKNIVPELEKNNKKLSDIIIMASILEGESSGKDDIYIISGILWKRISIDMPLQVDVDKSTYANKGLPSKPINNPGILSIEAAINPKSSPYLYYLHDKKGQVYFSKSYEEHINNINKYLK